MLLAVILAVVVPVGAAASTHPTTAPKPHIIGTWPDDVNFCGEPVGAAESSRGEARQRFGPEPSRHDEPPVFRREVEGVIAGGRVPSRRTSGECP